MREYKRVFLLVLIMTAVAVSIGGFAILILYETAIAEQRQRLVDAAASQARLIEAIIRREQAVHRSAGEARAAALSQIRDGATALVRPWPGAHFVLAERRGEEIAFLSRSQDQGLPTPMPFAADAAEPMRRALSGESGSMIGPDHRGVTVLAAYRPVAPLDLGLVVEMDLADVRTPFSG